jgi:hypothetical protein
LRSQTGLPALCELLFDALEVEVERESAFTTATVFVGFLAILIAGMIM